jgi:hypothetical protein
MIFDSTKLDSLWAWARLQAPPHYDETQMIGARWCRRRVRLELSAEDTDPPQLTSKYFHIKTFDRIIARVYLAEPRCKEPDGCRDELPHECGPLAETRVA